jgi:hypothetical protein
VLVEVLGVRKLVNEVTRHDGVGDASCETRSEGLVGNEGALHSLNPTRLGIHGCLLLNLDPLPVRLAESTPSHAIIQLGTKRRPQDGALSHSSNRFRVPEDRSILLPHTISAKCRFIATIPDS